MKMISHRVLLPFTFLLILSYASVAQLADSAIKAFMTYKLSSDTALASQLYAVSFKLNVPHRDSVFIEGYGIAKNFDEVRFLTNKKIVKILSADSTTLLKTLSLINATILQSVLAFDMPEPKDFAAAYRELTIQNPVTFGKKVNGILEKSCPFGILPNQSNGIIQLTSPYIELETPQGSHKNGQIALLISYPYHKDNDLVARFQFVARENLSHSPSWRPAGKEVLKRAETFVNNFIIAIQ